MIPWRRANEVLHDQAFDSDQSRDLLGVLAWQVGQEARQVEVHMTFLRVSLQTLLIGHHKVIQAINDGVEHVRGHDTIVQQCLLTLCPHGSHLFASLEWYMGMGCSLEAIDITMRYITQEGSLRGYTVRYRGGRLSTLATSSIANVVAQPVVSLRPVGRRVGVLLHIFTQGAVDARLIALAVRRMTLEPGNHVG